MTRPAGPVLVGAVAYDPKVVTIWEGFRQHLRDEGVDTDFVLYSNYERQTEELLAGRIDMAWSSPLAWVRARRLAAAAGGGTVRPLFMRDTDRDLRSAVVTRSGSGIASIDDLRGRRIAVGAVDSPQATLLPLSLLRAAGLEPGTEPGADVEVVRFDVGIGLHGDHIGGERDAAAALRDGKVDAACMTDSNLLLFSREGTVWAVRNSMSPGSRRTWCGRTSRRSCTRALPRRSGIPTRWWTGGPVTRCPPTSRTRSCRS